MSPLIAFTGFQLCLPMGFPGGSVVKKKKKNLLANAGDVGLILGSGRFPGGGHGFPDQITSLVWETP